MKGRSMTETTRIFGGYLRRTFDARGQVADAVPSRMDKRAQVFASAEYGSITIFGVYIILFLS